MLASKFVLALVFSVMICNSVCGEDRYDKVIDYCQESLQKLQSDSYEIESYEKRLTGLTKTSEEVSGKKVKLEQVVKEIEEAMSKITTAAGV
ncbi:unnamed protein product [Calicophoron daubneyi]|uniref:Uncharacterized protein n=1 Tax=Calicophoron daubneyi TaxID=300641 RepID=A0AAV2TKN8_CALDB